MQNTKKKKYLYRQKENRIKVKFNVKTSKHVSYYQLRRFEKTITITTINKKEKQNSDIVYSGMNISMYAYGCAEKAENCFIPNISIYILFLFRVISHRPNSYIKRQPLKTTHQIVSSIVQSNY